MSVSLPHDLGLAVEHAAAGLSGGGLREAAESLSRAYRDAEASRMAIRSATDVIAYALSRMPATYAAVATALSELSARAPDFRPMRMIDAGAGPGTATWAARQQFDSLQTAELRDTHPRFLALAQDLGLTQRGLDLTLRQADLGAGSVTTVDLVICAYALTELDDRAYTAAAQALWTQCNGVLVIVEPGRPRDVTRLLAIRTSLVAAGAEVIAPCPHGAACPVTPPDWCHFSVRLPRSRVHMALKSGSLGYEDEKFAYLIAARPGIGTPARARVIKPIVENKHEVRLDLCAENGLAVKAVPSRDRASFKVARKLRWGDESNL